MIFGCIADVLKHCKVSTKFYIDILITACDENIKKNAKKKYEDLNLRWSNLQNQLEIIPMNAT